MSLPPLEGTADGTIVIERVMTDLGGLAEPVVVDVRTVGRGQSRAARRRPGCAN